jgi:hypothetical protein
MNSSNRTDTAIVTAFAVVAAVAIVAPLTLTASPVRFVGAFAGVILGPGVLAYRLANGRSWGECLAVGIPLNVATVMLLGLLLVDAHFWYPTPFELLIPLTTCLLCGVLLRRERRGSSGRSSPFEDTAVARSRDTRVG